MHQQGRGSLPTSRGLRTTTEAGLRWRNPTSKVLVHLIIGHAIEHRVELLLRHRRPQRAHRITCSSKVSLE